MTVLRDLDIVALAVNAQIPIIKDLPPPPTLPACPGGQPSADDAWYGIDSAIQPASVDLHIGFICIPEVKHGERGSVDKSLVEHSLKFGHTAAVETREELDLPPDIIGFGFPPSHVAFRGLLMINPGHIDPGFKGKLRFTVINVGKDDIFLKAGEPIFTMLLVRLSGSVKRSYNERKADRPKVGSSSLPDAESQSREKFQSQLDRLSSDFLDVKGRTEKAAATAVANAGFRGPLWTAVIGAIVVLLTTAGGWLYNGTYSLLPITHRLDHIELDLDLKKANSPIKDRLARIEAVLDLKDNKSRLDAIDELRSALEALRKQSPPTQSSTK